ncbi:TPA: hypothetical protein ACE6PJ_001593, partial [Neisseria gonorrhoeae]
MPSEGSGGIFRLPYRSLSVNAFKTSGYAVGGVFVRISPQHFEGRGGSFQDWTGFVPNRPHRNRLPAAELL